MLLTTNIFFFFNDTATTEIYTLSLHDALPIYNFKVFSKPEGYTFPKDKVQVIQEFRHKIVVEEGEQPMERSEEHTSELQSRQYLVCRLLLEKKKKKTKGNINIKHITYDNRKL